jgi:hypothetical protein
MQPKFPGRCPTSLVTLSKQRFCKVRLCKLHRNRYHVIATVLAAAEYLVLGFSFCCIGCTSPCRANVSRHIFRSRLPPRLPPPLPPKRSTIFISAKRVGRRRTSSYISSSFEASVSSSFPLPQTSKPIDINFCIDSNRKRNVSQLGDWWRIF